MSFQRCAGLPGTSRQLSVKPRVNGRAPVARHASGCSRGACGSIGGACAPAGAAT
jgi:hypothetical protein